ncbi:MAG: DnaB-like helicase C-terminal domain-containing protein [Fusobacteriaceae bacterium]
MEDVVFYALGLSVNYPKHIIKDLPNAEARVLGTFVRDMTLIGDIEGKGDLFHTIDGKTYFELMKDMHSHGVSEFDLGAVESSLKRLGKEFEGIYRQINGTGHLKALAKEFSPLNFESHLLALMKINTSMSTYKCVWEATVNMQNEENQIGDITDFIEGLDERLNDAKDLSELSGVEAEEINIDDDFLKAKIEGTNKGVPYGIYSMSKATQGLHLGNMSMISAFVNNGKTTVNYNHIMIPLVEAGEKVLIYSNESFIEDFKSMILIKVLYTKLKYYKLTRTKLNRLDEIKKNNPIEFEDIMLHIEKAKQIIAKDYAPNIKVVCVSKYSISEFVSYMRKFSAKGFKYFMLDTMKSEDAGDKVATGRLVQQSRHIYEMARKLKVHVMASYQMATYLKKDMKRVLDDSALAGAKQVSEILDILICMRELYPDEYSGQKNALKVYKLVKTEVDGKFIYNREYQVIDPQHKYVIMFLAKSRYGAKIDPVVYRFDGDFGSIWEVGTAENCMDK